jgi:signal transduction histidine kinase
VTLRDLSEQRRRHLQERFLAIVGHELRAPVSSLLASAEILLAHLHEENDSVGARAGARRVYRLAERLGGMVHDLLDLARVSNEKLRVEQEIVDLASVVDSAVEIARTLSTGPAIHVEAPPDRVTVRGDSGRLGQVVLNLLSNALEHAFSSGPIDVRVKLSHHEAIVEVQDYGQGIPPDELPFIFSRYYQVQRATDDDAAAREGLGLGLFISEQIVKAHDGHIDVVSVPGVGTRFAVHLPRCRHEAFLAE